MLPTLRLLEDFAGLDVLVELFREQQVKSRVMQTEVADQIDAERQAALVDDENADTVLAQHQEAEAEKEAEREVEINAFKTSEDAPADARAIISQAKAFKKIADAGAGMMDSVEDVDQHFSGSTTFPAEINAVRTTPEATALVANPELYGPVRRKLADHLHDADKFADFTADYERTKHPAEIGTGRFGVEFDNSKAPRTQAAQTLRQEHETTLRLAMRSPGAMRRPGVSIAAPPAVPLALPQAPPPPEQLTQDRLKEIAELFARGGQSRRMKPVVFE